jgi:LytS/YehU family sensor histidine kinase
MKERTSGIRRTAGFCFLILLCVLANYFGGMFASAQKLPVWLDSVGTAMAAYVGGPIVGALVGVTGNLIGALAAVGNYLLLGITVAKAASGPKERIALRVRSSMTARLLGQAAAVALAVGVLHTNVYATILPLLFYRVGIAFRPLVDRRRGAAGKAAGSETDSDEGRDLLE